MQHIFDVDVAKEYGVDCAIFLKNISYWVFRNKANNENLHDGKYWTYNKVEAFQKIFPYWTYKQLRRIIDKCVNNDLVMKGNYNSSPYDKTLWYTFTDKGLVLFAYCTDEDGRLDSPKWALRVAQEGDTIPNNKPNNKPNIKIKDKAQSKKQIACDSKIVHLPDWLNKDLWEEFKQHRKSIKKPMSSLAEEKMIKALDKMRGDGQDIVQVLETSIANGWQGVFPIISKGDSYGKNSGHHGKKEKFDSWQYLHDSVRLDESQKNNTVSQDNVSVEDSQCLWLEGTDRGGY